MKEVYLSILNKLILLNNSFIQNIYWTFDNCPIYWQNISQTFDNFYFESLINNDLKAFNTISIWNDQVDQMRAGIINPLLPGVYVEIKKYNPLNLQQRLNASDLKITIHIVHFELDNPGAKDANINVIKYRNLVKFNLLGFAPVECGPMSSLPEEMDFNHDNLYHYVLPFRCHWIDSAAYNKGLTMSVGTYSVILSEPNQPIILNI